MECNQLCLNPSKTEWHWVSRPSEEKGFPTTGPGGIACAQSGGIFWDLWLLLQEQLATVARRTFAHLRVVRQLHLCLNWEALFIVAYASWPLVWIAVMRFYRGLPFSIQKLQLMQNVTAWVAKSVGCLTHVNNANVSDTGCQCASSYNSRSWLSPLKLFIVWDLAWSTEWLRDSVSWLY